MPTVTSPGAPTSVMFTVTVLSDEGGGLGGASVSIGGGGATAFGGKGGTSCKGGGDIWQCASFTSERQHADAAARRREPFIFSVHPELSTPLVATSSNVAWLALRALRSHLDTARTCSFTAARTSLDLPLYILL